MRKGRKQVWDRAPRRAQSSSYPPSPSPTPPRRTRQQDPVPFPSSTAIPANPRQTHTDQQSHAPESRAHCVPPCHGPAGGPRRKGAVGLGSRAALTAAASRQGTRPLRDPLPFLGPQRLGLPQCSPQAGGLRQGRTRARSLARSLTTVTGDTMAAAAAAGTPLRAAAAGTCPWPGGETTR